MEDDPYLPIFQLTRGDIVESIHYGSIAIADSAGNLVAWYGNPQTVTFTRSSAKPLQAIPLMEHGGKDIYHLTMQEIALICASHSGTDEHMAVLDSIQAKTGVRESDLMCGVHPPYHKPTADALRELGKTPTPNRHNCSGKHTGMLAYAHLLGLSPALNDLPYVDPSHPVQQDILRTFAEMCDLPTAQVHVGIDGCSAPNFAAPLRNVALAFARLCDPSGLPTARADACRDVTAAMTTYPNMIGGPDSFDTHLMNTMPGRLVCKGGAEGYQAMGLLPGALGPASPALGIVFKISDGDLKGHNRPVEDPRGRVRPPVALEILRQLGAFAPREMEKLADYGPTFPVDNWRKVIVGLAEPCFTLNYKPGGLPDHA
jgi:L-asparaginase II